MHSYIGKKVLITTSDWFLGPDGKDYKAVYGTLIGVHEAGKTLGFIPNRGHANWFLEIGNVTIMGCQVKYVLQTDETPSEESTTVWTSHEGVMKTYDRPNVIYICK